MCGRFAEYTSADDLLEAYGAAEASEAASRSALKVESSPYAEPLTIISTFMLPSCLVASAARA